MALTYDRIAKYALELRRMGAKMSVSTEQLTDWAADSGISDRDRWTLLRNTLNAANRLIPRLATAEDKLRATAIWMELRDG